MELLLEDPVGGNEVRSVIGNKGLSAWTTSHELADGIDERVGVELEDDLGVDASRLQAGKNGDPNFVGPSSVHLAGQGANKSSPVSSKGVPEVTREAGSGAIFCSRGFLKAR